MMVSVMVMKVMAMVMVMVMMVRVREVPFLCPEIPAAPLVRRGSFARSGDAALADPRPAALSAVTPLFLLLFLPRLPSRPIPAPCTAGFPRSAARCRLQVAPLRASPLRKRRRGGARGFKGGRLFLRWGRRKSEAPSSRRTLSEGSMHLAGILQSPSPAMCSVSEAGSTDPLVARFRQVEETLEKLHRENRSLKSKVPRYNALCTLYHESAQQLKHLQLQLAAKEATVRELRGSLARQQQQQQPGAGGEGAEPARSLVESLLEQLEQERERLRDSERLSGLRVEALNKEVQKLNQQLEEKNAEIEQMINQPPYEKEREILRLQKSLAEREKAQATSDVLCRSLTDETHQLQRKLASTAEMCQHLAKCYFCSGVLLCPPTLR